MPKSPQFTASQFNAMRPNLVKQLTAALEKELQDCALPDLGDDPDSDLWDLPPVDSKTVAKLSPVVKALVGRRLDPKWIRKGGYTSKEAAVQDLVANIGKHCVVGTTPAVVGNSVPATVTT